MPKKSKQISNLPPGLEILLNDYQNHCRRNGLKESSIELYLKEDRWVLHNLSANGCETAAQISAGHVAAACLALKSNYYLSTVKTFLRFLFSDGYTDRDYSYVVPEYKRPQPIPSVYSVDEIRRAENMDSGRCKKRNYAMLLLATRLGIRSGDIARLTFADVDFDTDVIRLIQQKTAARIELPLLPEIKAALTDYIDNERPKSDSSYIFTISRPPYNRVTIMQIGKTVACALKNAEIECGARSRGPHAFRSSLASSMVNDNVPYEIVRKTLGHVDPNAIKSYARLDVERLRLYSLAPPEASGGFAELLAGRRVM
ncbi:MAG: tyrosine-type recombinase/integrase [Oscillospiraceae bacterium]|nr:tyrosine-type recombinase/integrase [Oscillospiraceae bacterium]